MEQYQVRVFCENNFHWRVVECHFDRPKARIIKYEIGIEIGDRFYDIKFMASNFSPQHHHDILRLIATSQISWAC